MGDWSIYNSRSIIAFGCAGGPPPRFEELLFRSRLGLGLVSLSFLVIALVAKAKNPVSDTTWKFLVLYRSN